MFRLGTSEIHSSFGLRHSTFSPPARSGSMQSLPCWLSNYGSMSRRISVLVVDGHSILRAALVVAVHMSDELVLAGEASTAAQALELCRDTRPEIVLLGLHLPDMKPSAAVAKLSADSPGTRSIAI